MSHEYEDSNVMKAFFGGKIKINEKEPNYERVELGHGTGIGHKDGSYSQYVKQLSQQKGNGILYLGKAIEEDKDIMSMIDETEEFNAGDIPKLLVMHNNIINEIALKVEWMDNDNETILEQQYKIPLPYSMNYYWWDTYYTYFIGPENLEEGDYKINIMSTEIVRNRQLQELSATIEFSIV